MGRMEVFNVQPKLPDAVSALTKTLLTLAIFLASVGCSLLVNLFGVESESIIMVFLLGVLFTCVATSSRLCGVIAAVVSVVTFNFLFTEPRYTFLMYRASDIMLLAFFLVTAVVTATVTLRLRQQMTLSARNEQVARIMYRIASGFLSLSGARRMIDEGATYIREYTKHDCIVHMQGEPEPEFSEPYLPYVLMDDAQRLGEFRVLGGAPDEQDEKIVQAVTSQLGIALERDHLVSEREEIRLAMEREKQRSMLLRSVAHDLRSPLTALSGACSLLADNYDALDNAQRKKLAQDMSEEIIWLTSLVENILSMTRINEAQLVIHKQEEVVDDVVTEAVSHTARLFSERPFSVRLPDEVVTAPMDGKLIVQVIVNLLENAARHTPPGRAVSLEVEASGETLRVRVTDEGEGVPQEVSARLFERFAALERSVSDAGQGLGLGLAICKAIVEAHGGRIGVEPNSPRGARFFFTLPMREEARA